MNRLGIPMFDRKALSTADYNAMASNLAGRQTLNGKSQTAYEKAFIGMVAGFDTYKLDYAYRLTAAAGTSVTVNGANQRYVPVATTLDAGGLVYVNKDNRYQTLAITVGGGTVKVGDAFTIAGVNEVHHITKADTGSLKTFRITAILTGAGGTGNIQISPPIIAADSSPTDPELQYKNVTAAPANGAAITFLNTVGSGQSVLAGRRFRDRPGRTSRPRTAAWRSCRQPPTAASRCDGPPGRDRRPLHQVSLGRVLRPRQQAAGDDRHRAVQPDLKDAIRESTKDAYDGRRRRGLWRRARQSHRIDRSWRVPASASARPVRRRAEG
jgi:hypothetical protein